MTACLARADRGPCIEDVSFIGKRRTSRNCAAGPEPKFLHIVPLDNMNQVAVQVLSENTNVST